MYLFKSILIILHIVIQTILKTLKGCIIFRTSLVNENCVLYNNLTKSYDL